MTTVLAQGGVDLPDDGVVESGDDGGDPRYRLVYEEALGAIDRQERTLDELRARVSATLATAVIATAFFGSLAIKNGHPLGRLQIAAVALFVATTALQLILLLPLPGWQFARSPSLLIRDYVESDPPATLDEMHRDLALYIAQHVRGNSGRLRWMWRVFSAAAVVLVAEVVVWLLAISHFS